ncbi:DUF6507 family protein [Streptomyces sp. INA 01156]
MTGWDISPSGVQRVLTRTAEAAEGLSDTGKALQETLPSAAKSAGTVQQGGAEKRGPGPGRGGAGRVLHRLPGSSCTSRCARRTP